MKRFASAIWHDGSKNGIGIISTESGLLKQAPYTFGARFQGMPGTNPEELLAAAHASSYSLTLAAELNKAGLVPEVIRTAAVLSMEEIEEGWTVTQIHLDVIVRIPDTDVAAFEAAANEAKARCPISRLFNTKVTLSAKLEGANGHELKSARKSVSIHLRTRSDSNKSQKKFEEISVGNSKH